MTYKNSVPIGILFNLYSERTKIRNYLVVGFLFSLLYACLEYVVRIDTSYPQAFLPLIIRATILGQLIMGSIAIFEIMTKTKFSQKQFLFIILTRAISYTAIITIWLVSINSIWYSITDLNSATFMEKLIKYIVDDTYLINIGIAFVFVILTLAFSEINSLHRKGELLNFILGKFHVPKEIDLIFCFIDLKNSTKIAEELGHLQFAFFLRDYYSDITEAIRSTKAQIYQYVGDEIILRWSYKNGLKNNNLLNCFFTMREIINSKKEIYVQKYGYYPEFKAGIHGGKVILTWVGELKKEIVCIGDVLNTTARIQEQCKHLSKDFLISEELLNKIKNLGNIRESFIEEAKLKGKKSAIKLYSLELSNKCLLTH